MKETVVAFSVSAQPSGILPPRGTRGPHKNVGHLIAFDGKALAPISLLRARQSQSLTFFPQINDMTPETALPFCKQTSPSLVWSLHTPLGKPTPPFFREEN